MEQENFGVLELREETMTRGLYGFRVEPPVQVHELWFVAGDQEFHIATSHDMDDITSQALIFKDAIEEIGGNVKFINEVSA